MAAELEARDWDAGDRGATGARNPHRSLGRRPKSSDARSSRVRDPGGGGTGVDRRDEGRGHRRSFVADLRRLPRRRAGRDEHPVPRRRGHRRLRASARTRRRAVEDRSRDHVGGLSRRGRAPATATASCSRPTSACPCTGRLGFAETGRPLRATCGLPTRSNATVRRGSECHEGRLSERETRVVDGVDPRRQEHVRGRWSEPQACRRCAACARRRAVLVGGAAPDREGLPNSTTEARGLPPAFASCASPAVTLYLRGG